MRRWARSRMCWPMCMGFIRSRFGLKRRSRLKNRTALESLRSLDGHTQIRASLVFDENVPRSMKFSALIDFADNLKGSARLCVMPVPRLTLNEKCYSLEGFVFYPRSTLDLEELRIVWVPAVEFTKKSGRGATAPSKPRAATLNGLSPDFPFGSNNWCD